MTKHNRIAVFLGHPAHYHMFKHTIADLERMGVEVDLLVKRKDILEELVRSSGHPYYIVRRKERPAKHKLGLALALLGMEFRVIAYIIRRRPRLLVGTYAPVLSHLTGVHMIVCCEDDASVVPRFARTSYPYANAILAPKYCDCGRWDGKATKYAGFQKLAYLHPDRFVPDRDVVAPHLRDAGRPFVLMRFAKLQAHHDEGVGGMSNGLALRLIEMLKDRYDVYISSERPLSAELECYRLHINPMDIHHWLAFAAIYIGDSQSMAVEAAMLGTPSVRYSGFAQKIGVLNVLEERYGLTKGIPAGRPDELCSEVASLVATPDLRGLYRLRRSAMLAEQVDVARFFTDFIYNRLCTISHLKHTAD